MFLSMLVAVAVATPERYTSLMPQLSPSPKAILRAFVRLQPPPGLALPPVTMTLNVIPPAGAAYTVTLSLDPNLGWVGTAPVNAPFPGGRYTVQPYLQIKDGLRRLPDLSIDPTQFACRIRCLSPSTGADYGGGDIRHNAGPGFSAGPTQAGAVTAGYTFTVGP